MSLETCHEAHTLQLQLDYMKHYVSYAATDPVLMTENEASVPICSTSVCHTPTGSLSWGSHTKRY